ncbi:hypothetical protein BO94DRAFT_566707 [Aspergillus sclerotioniger CBS 115572]|uniref:Uncharacterized protein n=1 Tax=Aspergillus sclerotioniger CBS 115572 TaxID=1450535 RepID=A0A317WDY9_9EURO|nr:hypothetical protein BO94DRAFT_566707 [Aspergillus sclerotioniger CBS 115572]PWY84593.1 hypothetical protein BO94DRAFT_566707 [Aspergillus sclerotioniger CBS 115572]
MEPASQLILRTLPPLQKINGTAYASTSTETVSLRFFREWDNFERDVLQACGAIDLSQHVPLTGDQTENHVIGSELGLTGRFSKHVSDAVTKALSVTHLSGLKFGDYQALPNREADSVPDVVMLTLPDADAVAVGKLKTYWTVNLGRYSIRRGYMDLLPLQPHLGQLVQYMRQNGLKFGFLSTYKATVFVRRTAPFLFEITLPINEKATGPTLRQCFLAFAIFASSDPRFTEPEGFLESQLKMPSQPCAQASIRPSPYRNQVTTKDSTQGEAIGSQTIFFGGDDGVATGFVNCKRLIKKSGTKAIYEVQWDGRSAIAKCWTESRYPRYTDEAWTYEKLEMKSPEGYSFFPRLLTHGKICCSSVFPKGTGMPFPPPIKENIRVVIYEAIKTLRSIALVAIDCGRHNVLYNPETHAVAMVDFELMQACEADTTSPDQPEMFSIFEDRFLPVRIRHEGG